MKSIMSAQVAYRLMKFVLAAGTAALSGSVAYQAINGPEWLRVLGSVAAIVVLVIGLDGGFDKLEDLGRAKNGQDAHKPANERVQPSQYHIFFILGAVGVAGSIFLSLLSAGLLSRVVVDDKSGIVQEMESTKEKGDATYMKILASAERAVGSAEKVLSAAEAKRDAAGRNEVAAIGGNFAKLWNSGNEWVRIAPEMASQRRRVSKAIAAAQKDVDAANAALASANAAYTQVLTTGKQSADAGTAEIIQGQKVVLDNWVKSLSLVKNSFLMTDILAGIFAIAFGWLLYKTNALPDEPTLIEQGTRLVRLVGDAFVYAIAVGVTAAEKSIEGKMNFVAHPLPIGKTLPTVAPAQSIPYPAANTATPNGLTFVTLEEANELLEKLQQLRDKAVTDGDNDLAKKLQRDIEELNAKIDAFVTGQQTGQKSRQAHKNKANAKKAVTRTSSKKGRDIVPIKQRTTEQLLAARRKALSRQKTGKLTAIGKRNLSRFEAELSRRGYNFENRKA